MTDAADDRPIQADSPQPHPAVSTASVQTDRAHRYGKQLAAHLGRRAESQWDEATACGRLRFEYGSARLSATPASLEIRVEAEPEQLARLEDVVGRHLARFGARDELLVRWTRSDGSEGTMQRFTGDT